MIELDNQRSWKGDSLTKVRLGYLFFSHSKKGLKEVKDE
jgi:hypothetical protein|uniref:Uncharacterized protein n=1 Tax=Bacteriophage sp. TaxID=38018 RepID=A0A8D9PEZ7_9VIRU|nr:MAG TPA: hypothetical protein [Bacteriophage sp.]